MKPLGAEAETVLADAAAAAGTMIERGLHPTEAVAKAAADRGVPHGHVRLLVHACNTALAERQRRDGDGTLGKAAAVPLADAADVLEKLYPTTVKTAAARVRESVVASEYDLPPHWAKEAAACSRATKLLAAVDFALAPPCPPLPVWDGGAGRAYARTQTLYKEAFEAQGKREAAFIALNSAVAGLRDYFRSTGCVPFGEVRENAPLAFGKAAKILLDAMALDPLLRKQAAANPWPLVDGDRPPWSLVRACLDKAAALKDADDLAERTLTDNARKAREILSPYQPRPTTPGVMDIPDEGSPTVPAAIGPARFLPSGDARVKNAFPMGLMAAIMGTTLGRELATKFPAAKSTEQLRAKALEKITDPVHEQGIRNIQTESMLNNLLANDDVISGHDPQDVMSHYNELAQIAPHAANQEGLVRAMLRKRLQQGSFDTYDLESLIKMEGGLKNRESVPKGVMPEAQAAGAYY